MLVLGIIMLSVSVAALIAAVVLFALYRIFEYRPAMLKKASAYLKSTKHKMNMPVYENKTPRSPGRIVMIIKNWSKGKYEYIVNGKKYKVHYADLVTPHKMPKAVQVIYLKSFPKIAYVKTDTNSHYFEVYSLAALMLSIISALCGFSALFN